MITVRITESKLRSANACPEGIEWCKRAGLLDIDIVWTRLHTLWLSVSSAGRFASWARGRGLIPCADLRSADLSGAYYPYGTIPAGYTRSAAGYLARS